MSKKKSLPKLKQEAARLLQRLVRVKAAVAANRGGEIQCVTCGEWKHYKEMDGGHFIERGKILLVEENIHPQCKGCNGFKMKHTTGVLAYHRFMKDTYGQDFIDELERMAWKPQKFCAADLQDQIAEWKSLVDELEAQL